MFDGDCYAWPSFPELRDVDAANNSRELLELDPAVLHDASWGDDAAISAWNANDDEEEACYGVDENAGEDEAGELGLDDAADERNV